MAKTTKKKDPNQEAEAVAQKNIEQVQEGTSTVQEGTASKQGNQEAQQDTAEMFTPYEATVAVPLVVIRRGKTPRPKDKPIGTMARGVRVTVTASVDGFAMLANGTYVKEAYLERKE